MKFKNAMLIVKDIYVSCKLYEDVLGLRVICDFDVNKTLTGGLVLQTMDSYKELSGLEDISFKSNSFEIYFEEDDFDAFVKKLEKMDMSYVHQLIEHSWGQKVIRFYDPDMHIIEVGENIKAVCLRFLNSGMSKEEVAKRMDVPLKFVESCMR